VKGQTIDTKALLEHWPQHVVGEFCRYVDTSPGADTILVIWVSAWSSVPRVPPKPEGEICFRFEQHNSVSARVGEALSLYSCSINFPCYGN